MFHAHKKQPEVVPENDLGEQLRAARFAELNCLAITDAAKALIDHLTQQVMTWEAANEPRKHKRREKTQGKLRDAVESWTGDLLLACGRDQSKLVYRPLHRDNFSGERISYSAFRKVLKAFEALGLVANRSEAFTQFRGFGVQATYAPRFLATDKLTSLATEFGIGGKEYIQHFKLGLPYHPLRLKATKVRGDKTSDQLMPFSKTPQTEKLRKQVQALNEFLDQFELKGGTHRGFVRIFNNGDDPAFNWDMGGRLYSHGPDSYQLIPEVERLQMAIDGEAVCEIDVSASYLTMLCAKYGWPEGSRDELYEINGMPRAIVKLWVLIKIGHNKARPVEQWPDTVIDDYRKTSKGSYLESDYPVEEVGKAVMSKFVFLRRWRELPDTWATLMYRESDAVINTMLKLMDQGIPSYPVHDSIIVPASKAALAYGTLSECYEQACKVKPRLKMDCAPLA